MSERGEQGVTLIEIVDTMANLFDAYDEASEDEKPKVEQAIVETVQTQLRKVDNMVSYLRFLRTRQRHCNEEAARMRERARTLENQEARLENYIRYAMGLMGTRKLEGNTCTITLGKGRESVYVVDQKVIPEEYKRITVEEHIDKAAVRNAIKQGKSIPGVELQTGNEVVLVK